MNSTTSGDNTAVQSQSAQAQTGFLSSLRPRSSAILLVDQERPHNTTYTTPTHVPNVHPPARTHIGSHGGGGGTDSDHLTSDRDISTTSAGMVPSSPEEEGNFRRRFQIDMKGLVGDAVGNMSISPSGRDVVLAARKGLFIIDLEAPNKVPRFLPQGGTWDVADVQWNPHPARSEYVVSTSSEKLLIWNLNLVAKTSIEHILLSHYRAITDINWHNSEPDTLISTGIDSWLWAWDLRDPRKPTLGFSAFAAAGTQVKWNRQDANTIASSHMDEVYIWDRRKGSLPVSKIKAHGSKIYGIDWSHAKRNEILTCSLDRSIKLWNAETFNEGSPDPLTVIETTYPVWRARDLPFGRGVLSLPQRAETTLEMWAYGNSTDPVEIFEGHNDVVKEFVWRKGGPDDYQLITWSKDRTLRFWPIDQETMESVGHIPGRPESPVELTLRRDRKTSYRDPPKGTYLTSALSAPAGHRAILAEVRARPPIRQKSLLQRRDSAVFSNTERKAPTAVRFIPSRAHGADASTPILPPGRAFMTRRETMSRGNPVGRTADMDNLTWLSNFRDAPSRESSSGAESSRGSRVGSRVNSRTRTSSRERSNGSGRRSHSRPRDQEEYNLQEEITSTLLKLNAPTLKLEKIELSKRRTCTISLNGPWGQRSSVFLRVTFTFPKDYPRLGPAGTPSIDLERSPLISMRKRARMLRHLRAIRENRRPCLESCLRYLLYGDENESKQTPSSIKSDTSDEDDEGFVPAEKRTGEDITATLLMTSKNLAEPRSSQGVFSPNGDLVCFFRAPPRLVKHAAKKPSTSDSGSRFSHSPAILFDAIRHLTISANDRPQESTSAKRAENGDDILRIMTNLLPFPRPKVAKDSDFATIPESSSPPKYSLVPVRRSAVYLNRGTGLVGPERELAMHFVFQADSLINVCDTNAKIAKDHARTDHERMFMVLRTLVLPKRPARASSSSLRSLSRKMMIKLHQELAKSKDIQMLGMFASILLQNRHDTPREGPVAQNSQHNGSPIKIRTRLISGDYFTLSRLEEQGRHSPGSRSQPSPTTTTASASAASPRGSWSSLFNPVGGMSRFMNTTQENMANPRDSRSIDDSALNSTSVTHEDESTVPFPGGGSAEKEQQLHQRLASADTASNTGTISSISSNNTRMGRTPLRRLSTNASKSWSEALTSSSASSTSQPHSQRVTLSFSSTGHARPYLQLGTKRDVIHEKKGPRFIPPPPDNDGSGLNRQNASQNLVTDLPPEIVQQLIGHVTVYAELLMAWQLHHKRAELIKSVYPLIKAVFPLSSGSGSSFRTGWDKLGESQEILVETIHQLDRPLALSGGSGGGSGAIKPKPSCSICRLPVHGLSQTCDLCWHVVHISCRRDYSLPFCAAGCGCTCIVHV